MRGRLFGGAGETRMTCVTLQTIYVTRGPSYQVREQCMRDKKSIDCVRATIHQTGSSVTTPLKDAGQTNYSIVIGRTQTMHYAFLSTLAFDKQLFIAVQTLLRFNITVAQLLRPSGLSSCRPYGLELFPGFYPGPGDQYRLFQTSLKRICSLDASASSAVGVQDDNALYKSIYVLTLVLSRACHSWQWVSLRSMGFVIHWLRVINDVSTFFSR